MPFLETTDAEVRACQDCAARLANGESARLTNFTVSRWPLVLLCEHEVEVEMQAARDEAGELAARRR